MTPKERPIDTQAVDVFSCLNNRRLGEVMTPEERAAKVAYDKMIVCQGFTLADNLWEDQLPKLRKDWIDAIRAALEENTKTCRARVNCEHGHTVTIETVEEDGQIIITLPCLTCAVAEEREACAEIAATHGMNHPGYCNGGVNCWHGIAAAIRARGQQEVKS